MRFFPRRMNPISPSRPEEAIQVMETYIRDMQRAGEQMATILNKRFDRLEGQIQAMEARISALEHPEEGGDG